MISVIWMKNDRLVTGRVVRVSTRWHPVQGGWLREVCYHTDAGYVPAGAGVLSVTCGKTVGETK